eukprot:scaffold126205_cov36-Tisochrysis_lutea.AAC.1
MRLANGQPRQHCEEAARWCVTSLWKSTCASALRSSTKGLRSDMRPEVVMSLTALLSSVPGESPLRLRRLLAKAREQGEPAAAFARPSARRVHRAVVGGLRA